MRYDIDLTRVLMREPWHLDIDMEVDGEDVARVSYLDNYEILNWHDLVGAPFEDRDYDFVVSEIQRLLGNAGWTWDDNEGQWEPTYFSPFFETYES